MRIPRVNTPIVFRNNLKPEESKTESQVVKTEKSKEEEDKELEFFYQFQEWEAQKTNIELYLKRSSDTPKLTTEQDSSNLPN